MIGEQKLHKSEVFCNILFFSFFQLVNFWRLVFNTFNKYWNILITVSWTFVVKWNHLKISSDKPSIFYIKFVRTSNSTIVQKSKDPCRTRYCCQNPPPNHTSNLNMTFPHPHYSNSQFEWNSKLRRRRFFPTKVPKKKRWNRLIDGPSAHASDRQRTCCHRTGR